MNDSLQLDQAIQRAFEPAEPISGARLRAIADLAAREARRRAFRKRLFLAAGPVAVAASLALAVAFSALFGPSQPRADVVDVIGLLSELDGGFSDEMSGTPVETLLLAWQDSPSEQVFWEL